MIVNFNVSVAAELLFKALEWILKGSKGWKEERGEEEEEGKNMFGNRILHVY